MRFLRKILLIILVFLISVNCFSQEIRGLDFLKQYHQGFFTGALVKLEDGTEILKLALISVKHENILDLIQSQYGKISEVLWMGELETKVEKGDQVKILQINENSGTIRQRPDICKNPSAENLYNFLFKHNSTKDFVSPKTKLIKYNENAKYVNLGINPTLMSKFRHEFLGFADNLKIALRSFSNVEDKEEAAYYKERLNNLRIGKSLDILNIIISGNTKFSIMTGLSNLEANIVCNILLKLCTAEKINHDELKLLDRILDRYKQLQEHPEYYEVTFNSKKDYSAIEARKTAVRDKLIKYSGVTYSNDEDLVYATIHKIIEQDEKDPKSFFLGNVSELLDQEGVLDFILEAPKINHTVAEDVKNMVTMYKKARTLRRNLENDELFEQAEKMRLETPEFMTNSIHIMDMIIKLNMEHGMNMEDVVKNSPTVFTDNNIGFLLDEAKKAPTKNEEMILVAKAESIIDAKQKNSFDVTLIKWKLLGIKNYLEYEKDQEIFSDRLKKQNIDDVFDAMDKFIDKEGRLDEAEIRLFLGTKERNFKDSIYEQIDRYYHNHEGINNRFFELNLLVMGNAPSVLIDGQNLDICVYMAELALKYRNLFKRIYHYDINTAIEISVKENLLKILEAREHIKIKMEMKAGRVK